MYLWNIILHFLHNACLFCLFEYTLYHYLLIENLFFVFIFLSYFCFLFDVLVNYIYTVIGCQNTLMRHGYTRYFWWCFKKPMPPSPNCLFVCFFLIHVCFLFYFVFCFCFCCCYNNCVKQERIKQQFFCLCCKYNCGISV